MGTEKLTGIERELVLQYLIDGNVPVTITPVVKAYVDHLTLNSNFFPVAIKDNINVHKDGYIILENPPETVKRFAGKDVKVEFYFNRVGLYFISKLQDDNDSFVLTIPAEIDRIKDIPEEKNYDFSSIIYYEFRTAANLNLKCVPWNKTVLFSKPAWKEIPLENQKDAKILLERFVEEAKVEKNIGYGIQLIPVCNFLTANKSPIIEAMQDRQKNLQILYTDHERIVIGFEYTNYTFSSNDEYGFKFIFSLKEGPIASRDIFVTARVNKVYKTEDERYYCVDFKYTSIQEEDLRYLYEKSTSKIFD